MKRYSVLVAALAVVLALLPLASLRADTGSWSGWITDDACNAKGAKLVFFNNADKKIYKLDKQDVAKMHIGHEVTVKGEAKGDTIAVASIEPTPAPAQ